TRRRAPPPSRRRPARPPRATPRRTPRRARTWSPPNTSCCDPARLFLVTLDLRRPDALVELDGRLRGAGYFADEGLLTAVQLGVVLDRPLLLEGEPGVGKTEIAAVLARVLGRELIRLQCYEGLDAGQALYEWDYPKQLLAVRAAEAADREVADLYDEQFLLARPLLRALRASHGAVLLLDEIDRADSEFEAFLLEFLSDFAITIPEIGTIRAASPP